MPVKEFIPLTDAKLTTEKAVKPRRTLKELTTIETPGISPEQEREPEEQKAKPKRKSSPKKSPEKVNIKKDSTLIITEKPQAAEKIASALGSPRRISLGNVSYYELEHNGEKILVASAVGHLFGLNYVKGQKGFPVFNVEWRPNYETKSAAYTKKYYDVLSALSKRASKYVIATDFDVEGEVIGWNVLRFICKQNTALRMKYSTLTKDELIESFEKPLPTPHWGQAYAGETRHILDWIYGINLSRALMAAIKTSGSFKILSIGRVQGPALKIIVDREREIEKFKSEPYWNVIAHSNKVPYRHPEDIFDKKELDKFKGIKEANAETKVNEEKTPPPVPFDLTTLQREAYRWYKISPSQTLATAQKLYLAGLISYPRTSSQKIPDAIKPKAILKKLASNFPVASKTTRTTPIEGKKSDPAHPSIFPTGEFQELKDQEKKLYELIVKRFISCFSPDLTTSVTRTILTAKEKNSKGKPITFTASGLSIIEKGWAGIYPAVIEESEIPIVNGLVKIEKIEIEDRETQPPKRFSPSSLITLLEKKNLGTKATRSTIVDTLFERGYLEGTSIKATQLGLELISTLEKHSSIIIDENLTRQIEEEMESFHEESNTKELEKKEKVVVDKAEKIITDISKEFKSKEKEIGKSLAKGLEGLREEQKEANSLCPCPTCKDTEKGTLRITFSRKTKRYFVACSAYPKCTQTYSLPPGGYLKKVDKDCQECNFPLLMSLRKGKKPWIFCFNSQCPSNKARIDAWKAKQAEAQSSNEESQTNIKT